MEYLIRRGIPQRTAHDLVGRLVRKAIDRGVRLADLSLEEFREAHADLDAGVYEVLGPGMRWQRCRATARRARSRSGSKSNDGNRR